MANGGTPAKYITYKGETKTTTEWADETGITTSRLRSRYRQHEKGLMSLDDVFKAPAVVAPKKLAKTATELRTTSTEAFFKGFNDVFPPSDIKAEWENYRLTGVYGPGLEAMYRFRHMWPIDKISDPAQRQMLTQVYASQAVVFQPGTKPEKFTKVEP